MSCKSISWILIALCLAASGCKVSSAQAGVTNRWRDASVRFQIGETTQSDVLKHLGPPSQVIDLDDRLVFYYLLENEEKRDMILLVYNRSTIEVVYDRAIFFFDEKGRLTEQALSHEALPYSAPESEK